MVFALPPGTAQALELVHRGSTFRVLGGSRQRASRWTHEYVKLLLSPRHSRGITLVYQPAPGGGRPDARGAEGDARPRAAAAPALRSRDAGGGSGPRVPAGGGRAVSTGDEAVIAGRPFRLGVVYASAIPPAKAADGARVPRRLVSFDPAFGWPGGLVVAELRPSAPGRRPRRLRMSGEGWARWAGDRIEP